MTQVLPCMTLEYYLVRRTDDALAGIETYLTSPGRIGIDGVRPARRDELLCRA